MAELDRRHHKEEEEMKAERRLEIDADEYRTRAGIIKANVEYLERKRRELLGKVRNDECFRRMCMKWEPDLPPEKWLNQWSIESSNEHKRRLSMPVLAWLGPKDGTTWEGKEDPTWLKDLGNYLEESFPPVDGRNVRIEECKTYSRGGIDWSKRKAAREDAETRDAEWERIRIKRARDEAERKEYEAKAHELFMQIEEGKREQERLRIEQKKKAEAKEERDRAYREWERLYCNRYGYPCCHNTPSIETWWAKKKKKEAIEAGRREKAAAELKKKQEWERLTTPRHLRRWT
jgi:hypothetical protein